MEREYMHHPTLLSMNGHGVGNLWRENEDGYMEFWNYSASPEGYWHVTGRKKEDFNTDKLDGIRHREISYYDTWCEPTRFTEEGY